MILDHHDNCYDAIRRFSYALKCKNYEGALQSYTNLCQESAELTGKINKRIESVIQKIISIENDSLKKLGDYVNIIKEEPEPGCLKTVYIARVIKEYSDVLLNMVDVYRAEVNEDIYDKLKYSFKFQGDDRVSLCTIEEIEPVRKAYNI